MSGYRDNTGYDPYAYEQPGRPLRPYNWVQWSGVGFVVAGLAVLLVYFAGKVHLIAPVVRNIPTSTALVMIGVFLINSRREPGVQVGREQRDRNVRVMLITVGLVTVVLAAALVLDALGVFA